MVAGLPQSARGRGGHRSDKLRDVWARLAATAAGDDPELEGHALDLARQARADVSAVELDAIEFLDRFEVPADAQLPPIEALRAGGVSAASRRIEGNTVTTVRTSENSPLWINEMARGGGTVGMTLCPGKVGSSF